MGKLPQNQTQPGEGAPTVLTTKQLLLAIRALCVGQSLLAKAEEVALIAILKNAKVPSIAQPSTTNGEKDSTPHPIKETKRTRSDLSSNILEQLTMPLQEFIPSMSVRIDVTPDGNKVSSENATNDQVSDVKVFKNNSQHYLRFRLLITKFTYVFDFIRKVRMKFLI